MDLGLTDLELISACVYHDNAYVRTIDWRKLLKSHYSIYKLKLTNVQSVSLVDEAVKMINSKRIVAVSYIGIVIPVITITHSSPMVYRYTMTNEYCSQIYHVTDPYPKELLRKFGEFEETLTLTNPFYMGYTATSKLTDRLTFSSTCDTIEFSFAVLPEYHSFFTHLVWHTYYMYEPEDKIHLMKLSYNTNYKLQHSYFEALLIILCKIVPAEIGYYILSFMSIEDVFLALKNRDYIQDLELDDATLSCREGYIRCNHCRYCKLILEKFE